MSLQSTLQNIESHDFAARLGVANTLDMFYALAKQEAPVKELVLMLKNEGEAGRLLAHVSSLLGEQEDVRYRNSRDSAVAVCIWALDQTQPEFAKLLAANVLNSPRLWWARKAAMEFFGGTTTVAKMEQTGASMIETAGWKNGDSKTKNILIVPESSPELMSAGHITRPDAITVTSDAARTSEELPGEMTPDSPNSQTVTKAVDSWSNTHGA